MRSKASVVLALPGWVGEGSDKPEHGGWHFKENVSYQSEPAIFWIR